MPTTERLDEAHGYRQSANRPDVFSCTVEGTNMRLNCNQPFNYCPWCGVELPAGRTGTEHTPERD
jgi:hypothetical protein